MATTTFAQAGPSEPSTPWPAPAIEASTHGAIAFCQVYYETYDEPLRRVSEIPLLYHPGAKLIWNGNLVPTTSTELTAWLEAFPYSRHDLQTLDCHPAESPTPTSPPDLIVNVTGSVFSGPASFPLHGTSGANQPNPDKARKFHQMFMLRAVAGEGGLQPMYKIQTNNFRYIG
ncbi:hypothetical protein M231_00171 [Tremella mesenterica]|uniref:NTF2 domain-containing protein n=1 Tax=Tremella mesenterica TaxID=5217 RepID=A0A4V1M548_TREME|nr:uncharacterized protein TREMEDRAFT_67132 [Tremella mesenterica DSM 1558]EIW72915.1 hypothetical protein TREMEDRAFT_67132 [Tremella mesenterica DSM 1558]RXK42617.1 hypothetical protein M231_00171 [Tremella mesenterica]